MNPAGRTITLNAQLYKERAAFSPRVTEAGSETSSSYRQAMSFADTLHLESRARSSSTLSDELLSDSSYRDDRMGAYVYQDSVPLNLTVDWNWLSEEQNYELVAQLLDAFGLNPQRLLSSEVVEDLLPSFGVPLSPIALDALDLLSSEGGSSSIISASDLAGVLQDLGLNITDAQASSALQALGVNTTSSADPLGDLALLLLSGSVNATALEDSLEALGLNVTMLSIINDDNLALLLALSSNITTTDIFNSLGFNLTVGELDGIDLLDLSTRDLFQLLFATGLAPSGVTSTQLSIPSPYTVMHNSSSPHAAAAFNGHLIATAFQVCSPDNSRGSFGGSFSDSFSVSTGDNSLQYLVKNHPLPITVEESIEVRVVLSLLVSIFIVVPLCYIPASFVPFLVKERVSKSKHLQIVSSVSPYLYWAAAYAWDMFLFGVLTALVMGALFLFGDAAKVFIKNTESRLCMLLLLLLYGASAIPLSYLYSMSFDNFSTAQISIMAVNFLTGFVFVLAYYIMIR